MNIIHTCSVSKNSFSSGEEIMQTIIRQTDKAQDPPSD